MSEVTPVGVAAEKMQNIVAKAVSATTAVIRDEYDKVIADLRERIERTEQRPVSYTHLTLPTNREV